jgi:hypothetical protein
VLVVRIPRPRSLDLMGEPVLGRLTGENRKVLYGGGGETPAAGGTS